MERGTMVGEDIDGYVHVSQRSLAFQVGPSERQQRKISIQSISPTKLARNIDNDSQFRSLNDIEVLDVESAQDALKLIDVASVRFPVCEAIWVLSEKCLRIEPEQSESDSRKPCFRRVYIG